MPAEINNIVAASLESMEDAAILGVKPVGVLAIADAIPGYLSTELAGASLVGINLLQVMKRSCSWIQMLS